MYTKATFHLSSNAQHSREIEIKMAFRVPFVLPQNNVKQPKMRNQGCVRGRMLRLLMKCCPQPLEHC